MQNNKKSRTWLVIVIIVVLAVLAWFAYSYRTILIPSGTESQINKLESQSTSDEIGDIEKDLNATSLDGLNNELSDIEKELQNTGL